jgi:hypothetical protein
LAANDLEEVYDNQYVLPPILPIAYQSLPNPIQEQ